MDKADMGRLSSVVLLGAGWGWWKWMLRVDFLWHSRVIGKYYTGPLYIIYI